jgi:ABC-type multidrug transport system fused ATPase/permease subunit
VSKNSKSVNTHLFLYQQTKIDASSDEGEKAQNIIGDIEFDNVTFSYPARQESPVCFSNLFSD